MPDILGVRGAVRTEWLTRVWKQRDHSLIEIVLAAESNRSGNFVGISISTCDIIYSGHLQNMGPKEG